MSTNDRAPVAAIPAAIATASPSFAAGKYWNAWSVAIQWNNGEKYEQGTPLPQVRPWRRSTAVNDSTRIDLSGAGHAPHQHPLVGGPWRTAIASLRLLQLCDVLQPEHLVERRDPSLDRLQAQAPVELGQHLLQRAHDGP